MNLARAKINVTLIFLVSLVIITNCGASDSSDMGVESQPLVSAEPTETPEPTATPFPTVTPTSTPRPDPLYILGSDEWWEYVAPESSLADSDLSQSSIDADVKRIYAATFVTKAWLAGAKPWELDFGEFVRSTPFSELPALAQETAVKILEVEETTPWIRPYNQPESLEDFSFSIYVFWGACLTERSWSECEATISDATAEFIEVVAPSNDYIPELADFLFEVGQTSDRVIADYPAYFSVYLALVGLGDIKQSQESFSRFIADSYLPGSEISARAFLIVNRLVNDSTKKSSTHSDELFTAPVDADQALIGCILVYSAAPVRWGSFQRYLPPMEENCPNQYAKWNAQTRLGETEFTWIAWMNHALLR